MPIPPSPATLNTPPRRHGACALAAAWMALALCLLLAPASASAARVRPRIVNGKTTPITQAPFQVALYDPEFVEAAEPENLRPAVFCGGVILDATHVLTAAHCVTIGGGEAARPHEIAVLAGTNNVEKPELKTAGKGVEDPVTTTSFDPAWNPFSGEHDVGVLTLQNPLWEGPEPKIDGTSTIAPIAFAVASEAEAGKAATVSGWGFDKPVAPEAEPSEKELQEGFPSELQSAEVSILAGSVCASAYGEATLATGPFICAIGNKTPVTDSCFGDSGGPLFSGTPGKEEDRLLALVDLGAGCAQKEFPGVYQSMVDAANQAFATSKPPQAPINTAAPAVTGTLQVGQTVACAHGSWLGEPNEYRYRFYREEAGVSGPFFKAVTAASASPAYLLQAADGGRRILCVVGASNPGGYGLAVSDPVAVAAAAQPPAAQPPPPAPPPPSVAAAPPRPTLHLLSRSCKRSTCRVTARASAGAGLAAVARVEAKLSFKRRYSCRRHGRRTTCTRTVTRRLSAKRIPGSRFLVVASGLRPGSYTLTLVAVDKAGLRQRVPTKVALRVKRPRRH